MGGNSKIAWTHHTFNPWVGCTKVSPGCAHCYAEALAKRTGLAGWGDAGTRRMTSEAYWLQPLKWARDAEKAGERRRVFCASLADVLEDRPELEEPRARLWELIRLTAGWLDWLLLTKRIENAERMIPADVLALIWMGVSAEDQQRADERIPVLLRILARVRFISVEPMLGPVDLETVTESERLAALEAGYGSGYASRLIDGLDWAIVGGESGPGSRPCDVEWIRSIVRQCAAAGVPCFVKQLGAKPLEPERCGDCDPCLYGQPCPYLGSVGVPMELRDRKGGDMDEWPLDTRVRQYPEVKL